MQPSSHRTGPVEVINLVPSYLCPALLDDLACPPKSEGIAWDIVCDDRASSRHRSATNLNWGDKGGPRAHKHARADDCPVLAHSICKHRRDMM